MENKNQAKALSEQQIIECTYSGAYDNFGCLGGRYQQTWRYAKGNAILDKKYYPYTEKQGLCKDTRNIQKSKENSFRLENFKKIESNNSVALRTALQDGPVAATIRAGSRVFRDYANGILESKSCTSAFPDHEYDHGVLVIGYGQTILGLPYFLVKNSFGKSWGNQGYAMISAADNGEVGGTCGILNNLYQPIITTKNVNSKYNVQQSMF